MYTIADIAARLNESARTTVLTGAGVSAASGVPTSRGSQGLWRRFKPEDLPTPGAFARDSRLVSGAQVESRCQRRCRNDLIVATHARSLYMSTTSRRCNAPTRKR